jgi:hypothetical protein
MPTSGQQRSGFWMISIFALLFACVGCSHTTTGLSMTAERTAFIRHGITTRTEVVETLGPPLYDHGPERTIAYAWETEGVGWGYSVFGRYHEIDRKHDRWLFCVHFDDSNRVDRHGKTRQPETESWKESILRWLEMKVE